MSLNCSLNTKEINNTMIIKNPIIPARTLELKISLETISSENISSKSFVLFLASDIKSLLIKIIFNKSHSELDSESHNRC
mgnify:FL=1